MKTLGTRELKRFLKAHPDWKPLAQDKKLAATFTFDAYIDGLVFIARIAVHAEIANHHPDIQFSYNKVKVTLTTHDTKGLTKKDLKLAGTIDSLHKGK